MALNTSSLLALPGAAPRVYARYGGQLPSWAALVLTVVLAWLLARLVWALVPIPASAVWTPAPAVLSTAVSTRSSVDLAAISAAGLFGVWQPPAVAAAATQDLDSAPDTTLALTLIGILSDGRDARTSRALIGTQGGQEKPYAVGDDIARGVTLQAIFPDRVILSRGGRLETLRLDKDRNGGVPGVGGGAFAPAGQDGDGGDESEESDDGASASLGQIRQQLLTDPAKASDYIRVQPVPGGTGGLGGYRIYPGRDTAMFNAAGLRPGDVVTAVNGVQLNDPGRALQLLSDLSQSSNVVITVDRGGQPRNLNLNLAP